MTRSAFVTTTSPLTITYPGETVALPARRDASYSPTVGDKVAVVQLDGSKLLVLCKIA